jgi:uncharacterized glyoxalase superfamily protein PhnB
MEADSSVAKFGLYGAVTDKYGVRWMFQGQK